MSSIHNKVYVVLNGLNGCTGRLAHTPQGVEVRFCFIDLQKAQQFARLTKGKVMSVNTRINYELEENHVYIADRVEEMVAGKGKG